MFYLYIVMQMNVYIYIYIEGNLSFNGRISRI